MVNSIHKKQSSIPYKILCGFIELTFLSSVILPPTPVFAQTVLNLPVPGTMLPPSPGFMPVLMTGLTIHPDNPLRFDFIMDTGHSGLDIHSEEFKQESAKLIKYFMASLTTPEEELWVNLSPYEKDRMIPLDLGKTEMGRDMLAQDYLLKQLTASLMYPEEELGKEFWDKVYQKAKEKFGTTEIPLNTFNKIWIVPEDALVYEQDGSAFVIHSKLAVMLEEDYEALRQSKNTAQLAPEDTVVSGLQSQVVREVLIPEITKEINEGKNFANLRQIFNALILATWYKLRLKESLLGKVYVDQGKTKGIDSKDKQINEKIYTQYLEAFKKGVYNYIREDYDESTQQIIPRKYFSGGVSAARMRNGKWFGQFLVTVGLVLGLIAFSALPSAAQEEGKNILEGVGKQAGVTAEFVENPKVLEGLTVTVHNGKNVRPVLLAQKSTVANDERRDTSDEDTYPERSRRASSPVAKVLLVDDNSNLLSDRKRILEKNGYIVTAVNDGAEAWQAFKNGSFDLVLTDYEMPNLDGPGLISKIRAYEKEQSRQIPLPMIMVSAGITDEKEKKAQELGVPLYSKVFGKGELRNIAATVKEALKQVPASPMVDLLDNAPIVPTFERLIGSLGALEDGFTIRELSSVRPYYNGKEVKAGYIPMALNEEGRAIFKELLTGGEVGNKAYLMMLRSNQALFNGMSVLPFGILIQDSKTKQLVFFDLGEFFINEHDAVINQATFAKVLQPYVLKGLFDDIKEEIPTIIKLKRVKTAPPYQSLADHLYESLGTDGTFEVLTIEHEGIFSPLDPQSRDFREALLQDPGLFRNKNVLEIGAGTGINIIIALKFGARTVHATEPSKAHVFLSKINIQFAQDTKQILPIEEGVVEVVEGNGFGEFPDADIYVFNTPVIIAKDKLAEREESLGSLKSQSNFITEDVFRKLAGDLKVRLIRQKRAAAIWRVMPYPETAFPQVEDEELFVWYEKYRESARAQERAKRFLAQEGFEAAGIKKFSTDSVYLYLYKITGAAATSSPVLNDDEEGKSRNNEIINRIYQVLSRLLDTNERYLTEDLIRLSQIVDGFRDLSKDDLNRLSDKVEGEIEEIEKHSNISLLYKIIWQFLLHSIKEHMVEKHSEEAQKVDREKNFDIASLGGYAVMDRISSMFEEGSENKALADVYRKVNRIDSVEDLRKRLTPRLEGLLRWMIRNPRYLFLPEELKQFSFLDIPLLLDAHNQTSTAPFLNVLKTIFLDPPQGGKVLEIGTGMGHLTALLSYWVGEKGDVISVERIAELGDMARKTAERLDYTNIKFVQADGSKGYAPGAPYDGIILGAMADRSGVDVIREQLRVGGRMVVPIKKDRDTAALTLIVRTSSTDYQEFVLSPNAQYVPLVSDEELLQSEHRDKILGPEYKWVSVTPLPKSWDSIPFIDWESHEEKDPQIVGRIRLLEGKFKDQEFDTYAHYQHYNFATPSLVLTVWPMGSIEYNRDQNKIGAVILDKDYRGEENSYLLYNMLFSFLREHKNTSLPSVHYVESPRTAKAVRKYGYLPQRDGSFLVRYLGLGGDYVLYDSGIPVFKKALSFVPEIKMKPVSSPVDIKKFYEEYREQRSGMLESLNDLKISLSDNSIPAYFSLLKPILKFRRDITDWDMTDLDALYGENDIKGLKDRLGGLVIPAVDRVVTALNSVVKLRHLDRKNFYNGLKDQADRFLESAYQLLNILIVKYADEYQGDDEEYTIAIRSLYYSFMYQHDKKTIVVQPWERDWIVEEPYEGDRYSEVLFALEKGFPNQRGLWRSSLAIRWRLRKILRKAEETFSKSDKASSYGQYLPGRAVSAGVEEVPPAATGETILVLDPMSDREGTIKDLINEGYAAVGIPTAGDVLEKIKEGSTKIPLVIVEINAFSGAEGEKSFGEFLKDLRKESPLTKVIVYTHADHIIIKDLRNDFRDIRFINKRAGGSRQLLESVAEVIPAKAEGPPTSSPISDKVQSGIGRLKQWKVQFIIDRLKQWSVFAHKTSSRIAALQALGRIKGMTSPQLIDVVGHLIDQAEIIKGVGGDPELVVAALSALEEIKLAHGKKEESGKNRRVDEQIDHWIQSLQSLPEGDRRQEAVMNLFKITDDMTDRQLIKVVLYLEELTKDRKLKKTVRAALHTLKINYTFPLIRPVQRFLEALDKLMVRDESFQREISSSRLKEEFPREYEELSRFSKKFTELYKERKFGDINYYSLARSFLPAVIFMSMAVNDLIHKITDEHQKTPLSAYDQHLEEFLEKIYQMLDLADKEYPQYPFDSFFAYPHYPDHYGLSVRIISRRIEVRHVGFRVFREKIPENLSVSKTAFTIARRLLKQVNGDTPANEVARIARQAMADISASSPASSSVSEERVPTAARLVGMEATSDEGRLSGEAERASISAKTEATSDEIQTTKEVGGIDLNPALLDLQIKRDGNGIPLPLPMQPIENMHIEGFLPVIINIVPITNLPFLLGLDLPQQQENPVKLTYQELSLAVTPLREWFFAREPETTLI